jgi:hypothetical protein
LAAGLAHGLIFLAVMLGMIFVAMMMGMQFACLHAMMRGMGAMPGGAMGVMRCRIGIVFLVMLGGLAMVMRRFFMMFGSRMMMGAGGMLVRHDILLWWIRSAHTAYAK